MTGGERESDEEISRGAESNCIHEELYCLAQSWQGKLFSRHTARRRHYRKWWHQDWQRELWVRRHCHFISHHVEWSLHPLSWCKMSLQINKRQDLHLQQSKITCQFWHMNDFGGAQWNRDINSSEADEWRATNCRQNDLKTLSCQESTLPSTFTRAGGLRSFAFGVHDECYPENKVKKEMKKMIIQLVSLGNSRSFQSRTYLMGRSLEGVWPGRMPTCSSWMNWILIPFEGCVMLISYGFKLHQQVAQEL